ncbi:trichosurin-like [Tenrec ecaudatus]|uniref:trichosurin-like n=1 Tax=Tenrec ecaudatus TaxID=94439 RepID=UPI003F59F790
MKLLLLSVSLSLVCTHKSLDGVPGLAQLNAEQWTSFKIASDRLDKIKPQGTFRMFISSIWGFPSGDMQVNLVSRENGSCLPIEVTLTKTGDCGRYQVDYYGENIVVFVLGSPDTHVILLTQNFKDGQTTSLRELYVGSRGRHSCTRISSCLAPSCANLLLLATVRKNVAVKDVVIKMFEDVVVYFGIPKKNILDLSQEVPGPGHPTLRQGGDGRKLT